MQQLYELITTRQAEMHARAVAHLRAHDDAADADLVAAITRQLLALLAGEASPAVAPTDSDGLITALRACGACRAAGHELLAAADWPPDALPAAHEALARALDRLETALCTSWAGEVPTTPGDWSAKLAQAFRKLPIIITVTTVADGRYVEVNEMFEEVIGYRRDEMIGRTSTALNIVIDTEDRQRLLREVDRQGIVRDIEMGFRVKSGEVRLFLLSGEVIEFNGVPCLLNTLHDITERKRVEEALRFTQFSVEHASEAIFWIDPDGRIFFANDACTYLLGFSRDALLAMTVFDIDPRLTPERWLAHWDLLKQQRLVTVQSHLHMQDDNLVPVEITSNFLTYHAREYNCAFVHDITERQRSEEALNYRAYYDDLTALPNRYLFHDRLAHELIRAEREHHPLAVLFLDLDAFKEVNDSMGHSVGDQLLREVAERLRLCVRECDTLARMGGDEFVFVLPDLVNPAQNLEATAQRIHGALEQPFHINGHEIIISASIGITVAPEDGTTVDTLMGNADLAMYQAKEDGRNTYHFFSAEMSAALAERRELEQDLRRALERQEFELYYQPQVDVLQRRITCVEALVRWHHPRLGLLLPSKFIPLAEETGLIEPLGTWVLHAACAQAQAWRDAGLPDLVMAVNLSARQFESKNLLDVVQRVLRATGLPPRLLELEITETMTLRDMGRITMELHLLHGLGVRIAIDDFGVGHNAFGYLKQFPIDTLKIDRSFIWDLDEVPASAAITQAIIVLGQSLGMTLVAECVETRAQADRLHAQGCETFQGFLFSQAIPAADCAPLIANPEQLLLLLESKEMVP